MGRKRIVVGNWKLNKTIEEAKALAQSVALLDTANVEVGIAPVFTALTSVSEVAAGSSILVFAQNCHYEESGAFTGEVSPTFLKDAGATGVILGHSERRHVFGETDGVIGKKVRAALDAGLRVILCVGETEDQRNQNETETVVFRQLETGLSQCQQADMDKMVIAYEPVWAIGTGNTATPEQAQDVHEQIRQWIENKFQVGSTIQIQYGGSVKPANAAALLTQPDIDGALVGGASLTIENFRPIVETP